MRDPTARADARRRSQSVTFLAARRRKKLTFRGYLSGTFINISIS